MHNSNQFTYSQIRYMIWLYRLSPGGYGVKNVELAEALDFSKPSVHNMLKSLGELGIVRQESFGLAHLTDEGRLLARKYAACYGILEETMRDLCGDGAASENAICGLLADMPPSKVDELYASQKERK